MDLKLLWMLCAVMVCLADGYHILCIFGIPSRSHHHLGSGIVNALLKGGHEVTWVTPYPPKDPQKGLHVIDGSATRPITEAIDMTDRRNAQAGLSFVRKFSANITATVYGIPALKDALVKGRFDAVATETFFSDVEAGYAAVLQVPWILLSGIVMQPSTEAIVDEVRSIPVLPLLYNDFGIPMTLYERIVNVGLYNAMSFDNWWHRSEEEQRYQSLFSDLAKTRGVPLPPLDVAVRNLSIIFINSDPSLVPAQSVPPNVISIGGYHIDEVVPKLPKDLQDIMDSSPQGVVYFSMGSVLKSSALPRSTKQALLRVLGTLPYTVLWKFEEELKDLPKNVHIRPWMPQTSILAHKNTRVFITHGGLLSNLEAVRFGVPLIGVPVFGDQPANAARAQRAGYALRVAYDTDTMADHIGEALKKMMLTDQYHKRVKYLSSLFNKRLVPPSKVITHYVELAIESKGAHHLRSKAQLYQWYQLWMLDVLAVLLLTVYLAYRILKTIIKCILQVVRGSSKNKVKKH